MNCSQIRQQLDNYLDGELSQQAHENVRRHLDDCLDCRREYEAIKSLVERAVMLEQEVSPPRDLWPGILARIDQARSPGAPWWLQLAAAGLALAVLWVPLSVWWVDRQDHGSTTAVPIEAREDSMASRAELARSEDGVLLARTDLVTAIERHRDIIDDDTLQVLEDNMILLDQAIGELRVALDENPQDLRLHMLLASRYQQERKLLQKVSRV